MSGDRGLAVHVGPSRRPLLEQAVLDGGGRLVGLADAEAIVYHGSDDPDEIVTMLHPGVRWVQLPHAGVERWTGTGVITDERLWTSSVGAYAPQVAEHALALMLLAARGLHTLARAERWTPKATRLFAGSTVALVGAGGIARALAVLLEPFGCRLLAVSDSGDFPGADRTVPRAAYREVLPEADYVVLSAPSTPATHGMIGAAELDLMRADAWLVNVARGDLVVTDDLVSALRERRIGGAALDVTDPEPLPAGHPLWSLPSVIVTPHAANPDDAYWPTLAERVRENVRRVMAGEPTLGRIDPGSGF
ncbi:D-isomer specific 2-hydroxyacid dehydrogenase family protein [Microlunatus spumicola]|uniref:D-isomer specific 2-hydroxyacid dehydrogenase family protein n=1 Tax=Microlunatus spumicola TaxID=81499 RepID=A0ABP6WNM3_9ACTN